MADSIIDEVKKILIAEVFCAFFPGVELKRDGRNLVALCPLHSENTPSFKIDREKNRWKCFGSASCGGGSVIDLLLKGAFASKPLEAAKLIAEKFGIKVETKARGPRGKKGSVKHDTALQGLTVAALAKAKKLDETFLKSIGLRDVKYYDQRAVLIVYQTRNSEIFAYRYRLSIDKEPRFLWKSGSRTIIYGLERLESMRKTGWVLLVEGESDCWTAWQAGLPALGVPGKTTWRPEWKEYFKDLTVYLWQELDAEDFAERVARDVEDLYIIEAPNGIKDISEAHLAGKDLPGFIEQLKTTAIPAEKIARDKADAAMARIRRKAAGILAADDPFEIVIEAIKSAGYGGDLTPPLITYLSASSRLLKMRSGSMPVHLLILGIPSVGKSYTVKVVLRLLPDSVIHEIDAGSPRSLIYDEAILTHKIIIFGESDSLPMGEDNPAASAVRNLLQEHQLKYSVVVRDTKTGKYTTQNICKPGPSVLITTAVRGLGPQLGSRLFSLEVPDDAKQVSQALATQAEIELNGLAEANESLIAYQEYLQMLAPWDVVVPYADQLADAIGRSIVAPRMLRDFSRVLSLIKSVTILRHRHRLVDAKDRFVATVDDYRTVYDLVGGMYTASVTGASERVKSVVVAVAELESNAAVTVSITAVALHLNISKMAVSRAVRVALKNNWLVNTEPRKGYPANLQVGEALPDETGLPHPDTIRECNTVTPETGRNTGPLSLEDKGGWEAVL